MEEKVKDESPPREAMERVKTLIQEAEMKVARQEGNSRMGNIRETLRGAWQAWHWASSVIPLVLVSFWALGFAIVWASTTYTQWGQERAAAAEAEDERIYQELEVECFEAAGEFAQTYEVRYVRGTEPGLGQCQVKVFEPEGTYVWADLDDFQSSVLEQAAGSP